MNTADDDARRLSEASCRLLVWAHTEPGTSARDRGQAETLREDLRDAPSSPYAEARLSWLWLALCLGDAVQDAAPTLEALVREPLYAPFRGLAFRALAYVGRRGTVSAVLATPPASLDEADASLDAAAAADVGRVLLDPTAAGWLDAVPDASRVESDVAASWRALLRAETDLDAADSADARGALRRLTQLANEGEAATYDRSVHLRVAARAAAALVRARLAWGGDEAIAPAVLAMLPDWERAYLDGLHAWQRGDPAAAQTKLQEALRANPHQTSVRIAMAAVRAPATPEDALDLLQAVEPTRQLLSTRAALLARLRRYDEAEAALNGAPDAPNEPVRQSGSRWRRRCLRQEMALRAAMAERRGDWHNASRHHVDAFKLAPAPRPGRPAWLMESRETQRLRARRLFLDARRARAFQGPSWIKEQYETMVQQGDEELSASPLAGDARFFRALAMIDRSPDRSAEELAALFDEAAWLARERSVGSDRVLLAADALLLLGRVDQALRAYESVPRPWPAAVHERRAVALVYREFARGGTAGDVARAARAVKSFAPACFWPHVFAALAHAVTGPSPEGEASLAEAQRLGAPESVAGYLRAVTLSHEGRSLGASDLAALELPDETRRVLAALFPAAATPADAKDALAQLGEEWIGRFLVQPADATRQLLGEWCRQGRATDACETALRLVAPRGPLSTGFVAWVCLRRAVECATKSKWQDAETFLGRADALVQP